MYIHIPYTVHPVSLSRALTLTVRKLKREAAILFIPRCLKKKVSMKQHNIYQAPGRSNGCHVGHFCCGFILYLCIFPGAVSFAETL